MLNSNEKDITINEVNVEMKIELHIYTKNDLTMMNYIQIRWSYFFRKDVFFQMILFIKIANKPDRSNN
jgi:hypothetical protein